MRRRIDYESVTISPRAGDDIMDTIKAAVIISMRLKCPVLFDFNDKEMEVDIRPFLNEQYQKYNQSWKGEK